ncbi:MAG TPA: PP0621 family protein [Rhodocyclaceae bacterium]
MSKLFFLILLGVVVYLLLKRAQPPSRARQETRPTERMIQCAHCRIHVPLSESVSDGSARYCSEEHRRLARE